MSHWKAWIIFPTLPSWMAWSHCGKVTSQVLATWMVKQITPCNSCCNGMHFFFAPDTKQCLAISDLIQYEGFYYLKSSVTELMVSWTQDSWTWISLTWIQSTVSAWRDHHWVIIIMQPSYHSIMQQEASPSNSGFENTMNMEPPVVAQAYHVAQGPCNSDFMLMMSFLCLCSLLSYGHVAIQLSLCLLIQCWVTMRCKNFVCSCCNWASMPMLPGKNNHKLCKKTHWVPVSRTTQWLACGHFETGSEPCIQTWQQRLGHCSK